jgi:hypothetical protein
VLQEAACELGSGKTTIMLVNLVLERKLLSYNRGAIISHISPNLAHPPIGKNDLDTDIYFQKL